MTVNLAYRSLRKIPEDFLEEKPSFKKNVEVLDLSFNRFENLDSLEGYDRIHTLILDSNYINSHSKLPKMHSIKYLSLVNNQIGNLSIFIDTIIQKFPNIRYLNMLKNPAAPNYLNDGSLDEYNDYRLYVINCLPNIQVVDYIEVGDEERREARRVYGKIPSTRPVAKDTLPVSEGSSMATATAQK